MTLVTLFWGYPYTISQVQRHQRRLRHSNFVFYVASLFLRSSMVNHKRHFAIPVTVVTVFLAYPLPISHKHRRYRHHRHLKQASRFNLRLACFILSNVAGFLPHCLLKWI